MFLPLMGRSWLDVIFPDWRGGFQNIDTVCAVQGDTFKKPWIEGMIAQFNNVFSKSLNEPIKHYEADIILSAEATPIFCKPYTVPYGLRAKTEAELDKLCDQGIITPIRHSRWASPIVIVEKSDGSVRLCVDCKVTINKFVVTEHYPLPRFDDIMSNLANCKYFCVLDLSGAYLQVCVAEDSKKFLVINTHKGLYQYNRLVFGVSSAPSIFQGIMDKILVGLVNVQAFLDDLLVGGTTIEECKHNVHKVLTRLQKHRVKVNLDKCRFLEESVEYLGHIICADGIRPNPRKVDAISKAPSPKNVSELKSYLGLLNFYGRFIPNLSTNLNPLYKLLNKNDDFAWSANEELVFQNSKSFLLKNDLLVHYDPNKVIVVACDASPYGIGAVLSHLVDGEERPVMFVSSTLSPAEKNYSQLHREALAIIFGIKRFHKYIYGHKFLIYTDHQPLKEIFGPNKSTPPVAAARLQRWAVHLSMYTYQIVYRKSTLMCHADALSRLPVVGVSQVDNFPIFSISESNTDLNFKIITQETEKDDVLSKVYKYLKQGWPNALEPELKNFYLKKNSLSVEKNCVFYGNRIVIPSKLYQDVLKLLHDGHIGVVRMKLLARNYCWFPGIDSQIEDKAKTCPTCQSTANITKTSDTFRWPATTFPFERVHIDFFHFMAHTFLLYVDSYSKWIYVSVMGSTSAEKVIEQIRKIFAFVGFPKKLCSDNGPPFQSVDYNNFLQSNGIVVLKSPPYHPEANGLAERAVQTVKHSLKKFLADSVSREWSIQKKISQFMFRYNNTPTTTTNVAPVSLIFKYKPRTAIDAIMPEKCIKPSTTILKNKKPEIVNKPQVIHLKNNPDQKKLILYKEGEKIYYLNHFKNDVNWLEGIIKKKLSNTIYIISIADSLRTVHASQLKKNATKSVHFGANQYFTTETINKRKRKRSTSTEPVRRSERLKQMRQQRSSSI